MIEWLDCEVELADSGAMALEKHSAERFDLIFMDCQMPGMDGLETTRLIRDMERRTGAPHVPVIALTASAMQGDREKCLAAGMDDYVTKPVTQEQIGQILRSWLQDRDLAAAQGG